MQLQHPPTQQNHFLQNPVTNPKSKLQHRCLLQLRYWFSPLSDLLSDRDRLVYSPAAPESARGVPADSAVLIAVEMRGVTTSVKLSGIIALNLRTAEMLDGPAADGALLRGTYSSRMLRMSACMRLRRCTWYTANMRVSCTHIHKAGPD